jgi:hypothetical protein
MIVTATSRPAIGEPSITILAFRNDGSSYVRACYWNEIEEDEHGNLLTGDVDDILMDHQYSRVSVWQSDEGQWTAMVEPQ